MSHRWGLFPAVFFVVCLFSAGSSPAETLHSAVQYTLDTNPDVLISIKQRLAANQRFKQNRAGFFPSLDVNGDTGKERSKNFSTFQREVSLNRRNIMATLTENVFNGYGTYFNVRADLARINSAAYNVNNTAQNTALAVAEAYLNVLRTRKLVAIARNNVKAHRRTAYMISRRVEKGISRKSELQQAQGRLALSESNLYSEINNYQDAIAMYIQVVGKEPSNLKLPTYQMRLQPLSRRRAVSIAVQRNPAISSEQYKLYAAIAAHKATYAPDYPSVDVVLSSARGKNVNGIVGDNYDDSGFVQLNYNLFRGGADMARQKETAYQKEQAFEEIHKIEREVIENTMTAWNSWQITKLRLPKLKEHMVKSRFVINAYRKQYVVGKRTLIDLLNAESEYFSANRAYIDGQFSLILSHYRLFNRMGLLLDYLKIPLPATAYTTLHKYQNYHHFYRHNYTPPPTKPLPSPHYTHVRRKITRPHALVTRNAAQQSKKLVTSFIVPKSQRIKKHVVAHNIIQTIPPLFALPKSTPLYPHTPLATHIKNYSIAHTLYIHTKIHKVHNTQQRHKIFKTHKVMKQSPFVLPKPTALSSHKTKHIKKHIVVHTLHIHPQTHKVHNMHQRHKRLKTHKAIKLSPIALPKPTKKHIVAHTLHIHPHKIHHTVHQIAHKPIKLPALALPSPTRYRQQNYMHMLPPAPHKNKPLHLKYIPKKYRHEYHYHAIENLNSHP